MPIIQKGLGHLNTILLALLLKLELKPSEMCYKIELTGRATTGPAETAICMKLYSTINRKVQHWKILNGRICICIHFF